MKKENDSKERKRSVQPSVSTDGRSVAKKHPIKTSRKVTPKKQAPARKPASLTSARRKGCSIPPKHNYIPPITRIDDELDERKESERK